MHPSTENFASFTIVGIKARASNDYPESIGNLWQTFFAQGGVKQIPHRKNDDIFSVYMDYEGDYTKPYTVLIGCEVNEVTDLPDGLVAETIPATHYAVFDAKGPQPASVISTWRDIWSSPLVRAYTHDFDHYTGPEDVKVHVAVR